MSYVCDLCDLVGLLISLMGSDLLFNTPTYPERQVLIWYFTYEKGSSGLKVVGGVKK